jgi:hypothetical protein
LVSCGFNEDNGAVGVIIAILTEERDPVVAYAVFYFPEEQRWGVVNLMTGAEDEITTQTACEFVDQWLKLYDRALSGEEV